MKMAETKDGQPVMASATASLEAICPRCRGDVFLRSRKTMDNSLTWFWRHPENQGYECRQMLQVPQSAYDV